MCSKCRSVLIKDLPENVKSKNVQITETLKSKSAPKFIFGNQNIEDFMRRHLRIHQVKRKLIKENLIVHFEISNIGTVTNVAIINEIESKLSDSEKEVISQAFIEMPI